jgi:hypothetical protein
LVAALRSAVHAAHARVRETPRHDIGAVTIRRSSTMLAAGALQATARLTPEQALRAFAASSLNS